MLFLGFI